ncbi:MAG: hypothetical protein HKN27_09660 [Silicimonas sp.]|nr:hypothetical protein [Silicimonas sp.]
MGVVRAHVLAVADNLVEDQISFRAFHFTPKLPPGMTVRSCTAVILAFDELVEISKLSFGLSVDRQALGPCSGQYLDAQEWSCKGDLLVIGTEDGEALNLRFPRMDCEDEAVVSYTHKTLALNLTAMPYLNRPSFHFIIAENDNPEPVDASAWFAVDQNHDYLVRQLAHDRA